MPGLANSLGMHPFKGPGETELRVHLARSLTKAACRGSSSSAMVKEAKPKVSCTGSDPLFRVGWVAGWDSVTFCQPLHS